MRDQFVLGIFSSQSKQEIIKKFPSETSTFTEIEDYALTMEIALRDGETISAANPNTSVSQSHNIVNKISHKILILHPKTMCIRCGYNKHRDTQVKQSKKIVILVERKDIFNVHASNQVKQQFIKRIVKVRIVTIKQNLQGKIKKEVREKRSM